MIFQFDVYYTIATAGCLIVKTLVTPQSAKEFKAVTVQGVAPSSGNFKQVVTRNSNRNGMSPPFL